jgi:hypothetical protein
VVGAEAVAVVQVQLVDPVTESLAHLLVQVPVEMVAHIQ